MVVYQDCRQGQFRTHVPDAAYILPCLRISGYVKHRRFKKKVPRSLVVQVQIHMQPFVPETQFQTDIVFEGLFPCQILVCKSKRRLSYAQIRTESRIGIIQLCERA